MFYMFEVQIPVDAYPVFGLKRRSFLFVIDKNKEVTSRYLFIFRVRRREATSDFIPLRLVHKSDADFMPT